MHGAEHYASPQHEETQARATPAKPHLHPSAARSSATYSSVLFLHRDAPARFPHHPTVCRPSSGGAKLCESTIILQE